jgi:hypothetical protein
MSQVTSILRIRRHYSATAFAASSSARHFTGYTQYRDQHPDSQLANDVDGLVGYMRFRDVTADGGRMFDGAGVAGTAEREAVVGHIDSSFAGIHEGDGKRSSTNNLSYYDFIISPEDARGLDLKAVTRATMAQLGRDAASSGLPPWIAAEHRNTRHPHVHVVVAGIRRLPTGRHRTLQITPARLQNMKASMTNEIDRQREARSQSRAQAVKHIRVPERHSALDRGNPAPPDRGPSVARSPSAVRTVRPAPAYRSRTRPAVLGKANRFMARMARHYQLEMERAVRERKWASQHEPDEMELAV